MPTPRPATPSSPSSSAPTPAPLAAPLPSPTLIPTPPAVSIAVQFVAPAGFAGNSWVRDGRAARPRVLAAIVITPPAGDEQRANLFIIDEVGHSHMASAVPRAKDGATGEVRVWRPIDFGFVAGELVPGDVE